MSGGIHRVAQSRWNCPQATQATSLSIFFSLDCDLPAAGYLMVGIPAGSSHTPSTAGVHVWALGTSFAVPTTVTNAGTCGFTSNVLDCTFASALTKNTAYGMVIPGSGANTAGSWAPITMETRMNKLATAGPVMDVNRVFDSMAVDAAPLAITLAANKITATGATAKEFPGETALMEFVVTFGWANTVVVKQPWNLVLKMDTNSARNRAQVATSATWIKSPVTYADWTWGTTCTNTQWGIDDADTSDNVPAVTLKNKTPKCAVTTTTASYDMVIPIDQDLTATDFSTFKIKFQMDVTMPSNLIGKTVNVNGFIMDGNNYEMVAKTASATAMLSVTKPTGQANTDAAAIVSFGVNPNDSTAIGLGAGIFSTPYCIKADTTANNGFGAGYVSNCGITSAYTAAPASTGTQVLELNNAIELSWTLPYEVPNDRTYADIVCKTEQVTGGANNADKYNNDPMKVHQSSMMTKGFGTGNCFYLGALATAQGDHRFQCRDTGKLAKGAVLQLSFQFAIGNIGKSYLQGNAVDAPKQIVNTKAKTLACELKLNTYTSATSSAVTWYQATWTGNVDGNTQTSKNGQWQSFIGVESGYSSIGQHSANSGYQISVATAAAEFWLFLSMADRSGARADGGREFPFDTNVSDKDLFFYGYGSGLKTDATFTTLIQASTLYTGDTPNKFATPAQFKFDTSVYSNKAGEASQPAGVVKFKFGQGTWGGQCCKNAAACADTNGVKGCDLAAGSSLKLFAVQQVKQIAHAFMNALTGKKHYNAITKMTFNAVMAMPAHFTTVRGRGGFGSSTQKLCDIFWMMTSSHTSSHSLQTLMHFYVITKTAKSDADMKVVYGFPMNTYSATAAATKLSSNDGALALSTGMKLYIKAGDAPLADYYGFYVPRMQPFFKATGGNEIDVVVNSERAVKCWSWGSYNGAGFAKVKAFIGKEYWANKYFALVQYAGVNMVICKLGVATGTATTGDIIVIPATQSAPDTPAAVNNPLPCHLSTDPLSSTLESMGTAAGGGKNPAIIAGTDEYLGTMTVISNADTAAAGLYQTTALEGNDANTVPIPAKITQLNDNSNSQLYDIKPKTNPTTTWLIGAAKLDAILYFKQAAAATWADARSVMAVCSVATGTTLPVNAVIKGGNADTGHACTAAYSYTVGASDLNVVTGYSTRKARWCRWCNAPANSNNNELFLKDFVPPTTATRKVKGITVMSATTGGAINLAKDATETLTKQESVAMASGGCGKSGQTTKKSTKGQTVEFTMKSPVPLAAGQFVIWEDKDAAKTFALSGNIPANSVSCTCGTRTWTTTLAKESSGKRLKLTLPASGSTTTEVTCDKGDLSCKVREWSSSATVVADMTATCFACDSGSGSCTKENSAKTVAASGEGVARYNADVTFVFKQSGTASTDVLKVKDVAYQPNSKTAVGRFYYKPSTTMSLYGTYSTIAYTFGSQTFGTGAICQVFTSDGTAPSMVPSDLVSNCVISGSTVTVTMAKDGSANFHVQVTGMDAWLASASNKVTGTVTNFGAAVQAADTDATKQYAMSIVGTTATTSNEPTATMTVVVARTLVNVMDVGMIQFTVTPKGADFGKDSCAMISFPTYYNPNIGSMMRCSMYDAKAKADGERVYCKVAWDYTLMVMGPATAAKKDAAFVLRVYGVNMNLHAAAGNFGFGLTNSTYWASHKQLTEFKAAADTTTGVWGGKLAIDVTSVALSNNNLRASTDITIAFTLPTTTDTVTASSDYVAVQLPWQWMGVGAWADGTGTASAALKLVTTTGTGAAKKTTKTAVKGAVVQLSGCNVVFQLDTTATKLAEAASYEFTLSSVPTAEGAAGAAQMMLGSVVLSVGKVATGGFGYSQAMLFNALKAQTVPTGKALLEFSSQSVTISRGTYTKNAVCIQPASGNFAADVSVSVSGSLFKTNPAAVSAKMGAAKACADMGTASTTQTMMHCVRWTVNNGTAAYTNLPTLHTTVNSNKATVTVPDKVTCSLSGSSVPIIVTSSAVPFADVKVSMTTSIADDDKKTDNSVGITPNAGEVATLKIGSTQGVLGFKCGATVTGKELKYKLDGTDKAVFSLSSATCAVTAAKAGTKPTAPTMKLAMVADKSKAASTTVEGECPGMGASWIAFWPVALGDAVLASVADVKAAHGKFNAAATGLHGKQQWCYAAVAAAGGKTTCAFQTASKQVYNSALYCETIEGWFFASKKVVNMTSKDNGGKPVGLTLTYSKAISDITDNAMVLKVCGKLAEHMAVPYSRVTDAYGGFFGSPSPSLPASAPVAKAATTNTTANTTKTTTRMLQTTNKTANTTTAPKQTEWKLSLFVQPDPFAEKVDNAATATAASDTKAVAAIDTVTKAKYGSPTAKAAAITEAKVAWAKTGKPAATGGKLQITIKGSTDVAGYVYCAVSKTAVSRRMLNTTANATAANTTTTTPAAPKEVVTLQSASSAAKYNILRAETKTGALTFSLVFDKLEAGKTYKWMCEATSLSPGSPAFRTKMEEGQTATSPAEVQKKAGSALWSSLFAAVLMIAAVFFY